MNKVYGYVRSATSDASIAMQTNAIFRHCNDKKITLVEVFTDFSCSGISPPSERGGWRQLQANIAMNDVLLITSFDRISRAFDALAFELEKLNARGVSVEIIDEDC